MINIQAIENTLDEIRSNLDADLTNLIARLRINNTAIEHEQDIGTNDANKVQQAKKLADQKVKESVQLIKDFLRSKANHASAHILQQLIISYEN
jgi:hypothetical protein